LDDVETVTRHGQRMMMPDIPELPDIELKLEEVTDGQEEAEPRSTH
jgi:hypothetical protein